MRARSNRWLAIAAPLIVFSMLGAYAVAATRPTVEQVAQRLTCQCGCGLTVANCNMPTCSFSVPTRHHIRDLIAQGKSQVEIIAFYRHKYGEKVLSAPTTEGFNLLAWITPFGAMLAGAVVIVFTARRWRRNPVETPSPAPVSDPMDEPRFDPELRRKLAEDLRRGG